jgi:asparagine synthase (glutamine-hydrolysing)
VTVALTGDGGDEVFGGYNRYVDGRWLLGPASRLPRRIRRLLAAGTGVVGDDSADARSFRGRMGKIRRVLAEESAGGMYRSLHSAWLDPLAVVPGGVDAPGPYTDVVGGASPSDLVARMQLADQMVYLPDDLLHKVDRASMAVSLEARVPLLDHRVVEFAWRLPRHHLIRGRTGKWILRQVLDRYVPRRLIERPKMGFSVPLDRWLRGPLRGWGADLLWSDRLDDLEWLDARAVRRAWEDFQTGRGNRALAMWAVLVFLDWHNHWVADRPTLTSLGPAAKLG